MRPTLMRSRPISRALVACVAPISVVVDASRADDDHSQGILQRSTCHTPHDGPYHRNPTWVLRPELHIVGAI